MLGSIASFLVAAFALTGSPGPNTLSLAAVGASFGRVKGLEYMVGLSVGVLVVAAMVGTGLSGLILAVPGVTPIVSILAVLYFAYLAFRIATAPPLSEPTADTTQQAPRWYEGFSLSLVNPKAYAAMAALFSGYVLAASDPLADALFKAALIAATIFVVNITWLSLGAALTQKMRSPRTSRMINVSFAILLILSVAYSFALSF